MSVEYEPGIEEVQFWIGFELQPYSNKRLSNPLNGFFTITDQWSPNNGPQIEVTIYINFKGVKHRLGVFEYTYMMNVNGGQSAQMEVLNKSMGPLMYTQITERITVPVKKPSKCVPSISYVNEQRVTCAGEELFFDDFRGIALNPLKWTIERRIAGEPDEEFVFYSNQSLTTGSNGLRIEPQLLEDVYGANAQHKDLFVEDCTAPADSMGCSFDRRIYKTIIAPPIVSSQIRSSFSFKYGRVEIEAKLPRGNWIYPQLWLEPKGHKYNKTGYTAGLITLAKIENSSSEILSIKQGVILGAEEPVRSLFLGPSIGMRVFTSSSLNGGQVMLKFILIIRILLTLICPSEGLSFWIDSDQNYIGNWTEIAGIIPGADSWRSFSHPAPFDQEFHLTIGLGVGGRNEFPISSTPWERTSPQMRREFYRMKHEWYPTWTEDSKALEIRSVKVISL